MNHMADADTSLLSKPAKPAKPANGNTYLAILQATRKKEIHITEAEYGLLRALREMREQRQHCQMLIAFKDGKMWLYEANLFTTYSVATLPTPATAPSG